MKYVNYILSLFIFCACANIAEVQAQVSGNKVIEKVKDQVDEDKVIVYMKNGSKFEAKLIEWNQEEETMTFELFGNPVKFPSSDVRKIVGLDIGNSPVYNFKETGFYYHMRMNFISGNPGNRNNFQPGIGLSVAAGKRINRLLSVGGGIGFDEYIIRNSENILSTFGEVSGYLHEKNQSLSYNIAAGYGFAFLDEESNMTDAQGGWMVHPSVGLRLGKKDMKWTFDLGYKFQKANWVYNNWGSISDQRILYRRLTLRTGVMF